MFDLKIIVFFVCFIFLFGGVMVMFNQEVSTGEYTAPSGESYSEPGAGIFSTLYESVQLDTGIWVIDNWVASIAGAISAFLIYRALRGQG